MSGDQPHLIRATVGTYADRGASIAADRPASQIGVDDSGSREADASVHPGLGVTETLMHYHNKLAEQFGRLHQARLRIDAPVFALEHGLGDADLGTLKDMVRAAVKGGVEQPKYDKSWLTVVVYAVEIGYGDHVPHRPSMSIPILLGTTDVLRERSAVLTVCGEGRWSHAR